MKQSLLKLFSFMLMFGILFTPIVSRAEPKLATISPGVKLFIPMIAIKVRVVEMKLEDNDSDSIDKTLNTYYENYSVTLLEPINSEGVMPKIRAKIRIKRLIVQPGEFPPPAEKSHIALSYLADSLKQGAHGWLNVTLSTVDSVTTIIDAEYN